jgi:hypothetical protein
VCGRVLPTWQELGDPLGLPLSREREDELGEDGVDCQERPVDGRDVQRRGAVRAVAACVGGIMHVGGGSCMWGGIMHACLWDVMGTYGAIHTHGG